MNYSLLGMNYRLLGINYRLLGINYRLLGMIYKLNGGIQLFAVYTKYIFIQIHVVGLYSISIYSSISKFSSLYEAKTNPGKSCLTKVYTFYHTRGKLFFVM